MADTAPKPTYIRIESALIWILTRDLKQVAACEEARSSGTIFMKKEVIGFNDTSEALKEASWDWTKAWLQLRAAVLRDGIGLTGVPGPVAAQAPLASAPGSGATNLDEGVGKKPAPDDLFNMPAPQIKISCQEATELVLEVEGTINLTPTWLRVADQFFPVQKLDGEQHFHLRSAAWALQGGVSWSDVQVNRLHLAVYFPAIESPESVPVTGATDHKVHAIVQAYMALYPDGMPAGLTSKARDSALQGYLSNKVGREYSLPHIRKVLNQERKKSNAE